MRRFVQRVGEFAEELRRRRVIQVAILYGVVLFFLNDIADFLEVLGIPPTGVTTLMVVGAAAYPLVIVLAWIFELTVEGMRQTAPGPLSDLFGGTPARRSVTLGAAFLASLGLGWGAWHLSSANGAGDDPGTGTAEPRLDPRRIAVLYLDDYSEDGSLGYLAAALTEGMVHELSQVEGLRVASRNAMNAYREGDLPLDSLVRTLQAGSLVEGSVTRAGDRIRATVQLIDGETLDHLESRVIEGVLDDPFAFQDSLTQTVVRALRRRLGQEIRLRAQREGTDDPEAWTVFARGFEALDSYLSLIEEDPVAAERAVERADSFFALAEARDPNWLDPPLQRAVAAGRMANLRASLPGARDPAWAAVSDSIFTSILERAPDLAQALGGRGQLRARLARTPGVENASELLDQAEADLRRALALEPDHAPALWMLSDVLVSRGRFSEAVEAAEHAMASDAFLRVEGQTLWSLAYARLQEGPGDEVTRLCDEGRSRFPDRADFVWCQFVILGGFPQVEPDMDHAVALLDTLYRAAPETGRDDWMTYGTIWAARVAARSGLADSALALLAQVREPGETPPHLAYDEAYVQLLLGDRAKAVELLDRSLTLDNPDTAFVRNDWWLNDLHDFLPFRELVGLEDTAR